MKIVILAGGLGTRISEESHLKPKPMIEIGEKPILWHIMKEYYQCGFDEFIICSGYKQYIIKQWFADYYLFNSNITFDLSKGNDIIIHNNHSEKWKVTVVDTGLNTMTGGRIKRIKDYVNNERFMMTYGDGVSNIDLKELLKFHSNQNVIATLTAVKIGQRFGVLSIEDNMITSFREKLENDQERVNAGYMVLEPEIFDYIENDNTVFEKNPLEKLSQNHQLAAYKFDGFWQPMDTLREKEKLEELWQSGKAPWKTWED